MNNTVKFQLLGFGNARTYLMASLFIIGNIALPRFFHLFPQGGIQWLPIYFFTLIAAYKYGWKAGLLTAVLSPVVNTLLFGMPATAMLPVILTKSILLAGAAGIASYYFKRISIPILIMVVISYQTFGLLGEWAITGDLSNSIMNIRNALPGMFLQVIAGYILIKHNLLSKHI